MSARPHRLLPEGTYYVGARRQAAARREVAAVPLPGGGLVVTLAGSF